MTDIEHTCRICRGEGTPIQPLLHPCKCRGSIKYIHQDCLLEWLKHSNKSTEKCDICNEPYKFRTIYDPSMPSRIPLSLIWRKLLDIVQSTSLKAVSLSLYVICILIQVPLYWKFSGRIYTWAIDGNLPMANPDFLHALMFGEYNIMEYIASHVNVSPFEMAKYKFTKFVDYTYLSGIRHIFIAIVIHVSLFVEHEYVVRDEGYTKLYLKKVGKEPRQQLVDMLQQVVNGIRNDDPEGNNDQDANLQRLEMIANAFNDIRDGDGRNRDNLLRRALDRGFNENEENEENVNVNPVVGGHDNNANGARVPPIDAQEIVNALNGNNIHDLSDDENEGNALNAPAHNGIPEPIAEEDRVEIDRDENDEELDDDEADEEDDQRQDEDLEAAAEAAAIAARGNNGGVIEFLEIFGISLNLKTPIFLMFICDFVISAYLFVIYLVPHMLGNLVISLFGAFFKVLTSNIIPKISSFPTIQSFYNNYFSKISDTISNFDFSILQVYTPGPELSNFIQTSYNSILQYIIIPAVSIYKNLFVETTTPFTLVERMIFLAIGYGAIIFGVYKFMKSIISGTKPVLGTPRKIYRVLFEISTTGKVFLIFAIEIFFFPVYCGWLLDFCVAPLLLEQLTKTVNGSKTYLLLFTSCYEMLQQPFLRVFLYWALGTLYMLFFALFVGMVRMKILRPGVLFFIRSPDDPNANLIHDALVKPLMLQLSRIYLSAEVYTAFILVGIGGVTWGLRGFIYLTNSEKDYNVLLPIQIPSASTIILCLSVISRISACLPLLSKYTQQYWTRVFEISCHKLRLSHFIIGRPIHQERGYVVYRSFFHSLLKIGEPDYSKPVTYREALTIFQENSEVQAVFIPNGNYIRAPDKDTVSRKFIKKLFVAVTKDDKLLSKTEPRESKRMGYETPSSEEEEEYNSDDGYTIVYRPPNFKLRCFGLIIMLWLFAVVLILSIILCAIVLGRPFVSTLLLLFESEYSIFFRAKGFNWKLIDLGSIFIGLLIELLGLYIIDTKLNQADGAGSNEVIADDAHGQVNARIQRIREFARDMFVRNLMFVVIVVSSLFLWILWILSVHLLCIDYPLRIKYGNFENLYQFGEYLNASTSDSIEITPLSLLLHFVVSFWTLLPFIYYMLPLLGRNINETTNLPWIVGLYPVLINFASLHVPSLLIMTYMYYKDYDMLQSIYVWVGALALFFFGKSAYSIHKLFAKINDQVKNEKYVKGRAIENVDGGEDNEI